MKGSNCRRGSSYNVSPSNVYCLISLSHIDYLFKLFKATVTTFPLPIFHNLISLSWFPMLYLPTNILDKLQPSSTKYLFGVVLIVLHQTPWQSHQNPMEVDIEEVSWVGVVCMDAENFGSNQMMINLGFSKLADNGRAHEVAVARHENFRQFVRGEGRVRIVSFKEISMYDLQICI